MPYIPFNDRPNYRPTSHKGAVKSGELNYQVSSLINDFLAMKGLSYTSLNEVIGVLECAKLELYRRIAGPYENKKLGENGEVYVFQNTEA